MSHNIVRLIRGVRWCKFGASKIHEYLKSSSYFIRLITGVIAMIRCKVKEKIWKVVIMKKQIKCPYCGSTAVLRKAEYVYGKDTNEEHLYVCSRYPTCNSYVGVHSGTLIPKGSLANGDLRHKRIEAHKVFSQIWLKGIMSKKQAYRWMRYVFGLSSEQAHIGNYSLYYCEALIRACQEVLRNNHVA